MPAEFPFVFARVALTESWSLHLPLAFRLRLEDGAMVLWRPGFTIWLTAWNNGPGESVADRKAHFAAEASPSKFDEREHEEEGRLYYSYRLAEEADDEREPALYAFVFAEHGHVEMSIYFDDNAEAELAYQIHASVNGEPATLPDHGIYSQLCFATNMVMEDGQHVAYMYREEPDSDADSGWRFFCGHESQDYVDDPDNTQIYPIAFVAQATPDIVPLLLSAAGSQFERQNQQFVPV